MGDFVIDRILTDTDGTLVTRVDSTGKPTGGQFWTFNWNARNQTRREGCPQWINQIVVGNTTESAKNGKDIIRDDTSLVSSSRVSCDMQVIHVDKDGKVEFFEQVPYGLVPEVAAKKDPNDPKELPVALKLWLCKEPFDPGKTDVVNLTKGCVAEAAARLKEGPKKGPTGD